MAHRAPRRVRIVPIETTSAKSRPQACSRLGGRPGRHRRNSVRGLTIMRACFFLSNHHYSAIMTTLCGLLTSSKRLGPRRRAICRPRAEFNLAVKAIDHCLRQVLTAHSSMLPAADSCRDAPRRQPIPACNLPPYRNAQVAKADPSLRVTPCLIVPRLALFAAKL